MSASTKSPFAKIFAFLSGFQLATFTLAMLLLITFLGTLEQAEYGLVASQARYFESFFVDRIDVAACLRALAITDLGKFSIPVTIMPGGYTLMALLFVNLLLGGLIRIRKSPKVIGVIISHFAILFMIAAGAVSYHFAKEGILSLPEGETGDEFQSYHDRVIEIEKAPADDKAARKSLVIGEGLYEDLESGQGRTFTHESLPFDLMITNWKRNAEPRRDTKDRGDAVDGYYIQEVSLIDPKSDQAIVDEQLASACLAIVKDKKTGAEQKGILWEFSRAPWTATVNDVKYLIDLRRRTYRLPFAVRLDKTDEEKHPGTNRPRSFTSWVTKITGEREEKRVVTMNEPVRSNGYAVFQSSFSAGVEDGTGVKSSGFMIVENPSDHWPLISCIIVAFGLLIHFCMMLARAMKWHEWLTAGIAVLFFGGLFGVAIWKLY